MTSPGDELIDLCQQAREHIVLVAPFIKAAALERVLAAISPDVMTIRCVTRWRPEEIAVGVSDVEVYDLIQGRPGAQLSIHPWLHAKYFRVDERCLVGSANVTKRALGWASPSNLELMLEAPASSQALRSFESRLFGASFEASLQLRNDMASAASDMRVAGMHHELLTEEASGDHDDITCSWLPLCTRPDCLFQIYCGHDIDRIVGWTLTAGQRDLRALCIPAGLGRAAFDQFVAASIQLTSLVQRIHNLPATVITAEAGEQLIMSFATEECRIYNLAEHWRTIRAWLLYFLARSYRQPFGSDELHKGAEIGELRG
jgi:hypothetical protein